MLPLAKLAPLVVAGRLPVGWQSEEQQQLERPKLEAVRRGVCQFNNDSFDTTTYFEA